MLRHARRQAFALVVAAMLQSLPREGNGDNEVDAVEKARAFQVRRHERAHEVCQSLLAAVLETHEDACRSRARFIAQKRAGGGELRNLLPEQALWHVVFLALIARARQVHEAGGTNKAFAAQETGVANAAIARENEPAEVGGQSAQEIPYAEIGVQGEGLTPFLSVREQAAEAAEKLIAHHYAIVDGYDALGGVHPLLHLRVGRGRIHQGVPVAAYALGGFREFFLQICFPGGQRLERYGRMGVSVHHKFLSACSVSSDRNSRPRKLAKGLTIQRRRIA